MKSAIFALIFSAIAVAAASAAKCADLNGARVFLAQLYSHYPERDGGPTYDPTGQSAKAIFEPSLVALFRKNARLTPPGDVGAIDGDPFCDCQDSDGLSVKIGAVRPVDGSHATAHVDLRFAAGSPPETRRVDVFLVAFRGHWRVHDIRTKQTPSLRAYVAQANRFAMGYQKRHEINRISRGPGR